MHEYKIVIPVPGSTEEAAAQGHGIHGVLRVYGQPEEASLPANGSCEGKPLAIFTHGLLSHKNALFFRPMTGMVGMDSFRWDMVGEGESPGDWKAGDYPRSIEMLRHVVDYITKRFGYHIDLMVGHSKGCVVTSAYVSQYCSLGAKHRGHRPPRRMILCSGRIRMENLRRKDAVFNPQFERHGHAVINVKVRGVMKEYRIYPDDHESQCSFPTRQYVQQIPPHIRIFIAHGTLDEVVPVVDAGDMVSVLTSHPYRQPGTVHLELIEGADHNYRGEYNDILLKKAQQWLESSALALETSKPTTAVPTPVGVRRGALIVVEGLDRSGKSTQVERLVQRLQAQLVKFPDRTTSIGTMINSYLTQQSDVNDQSIHLLFSANRWEVITSILNALRRGQNVVCDRYAFSGIAYSRAKGLDLEWCISPDVGLPIPDLTLFLDVDEATATKRAAYGEERYEKRAFQRLVREAFYNVETLVRYAGATWVRIDAGASIDQVSEQIMSHVTRTSEHLPTNLMTLSLDVMRPALTFVPDANEKASL